MRLPLLSRSSLDLISSTSEAGMEQTSAKHDVSTNSLAPKCESMTESALFAPVTGNTLEHWNPGPPFINSPAEAYYAYVRRSSGMMFQFYGDGTLGPLWIIFALIMLNTHYAVAIKSTHLNLFWWIEMKCVSIPLRKYLLRMDLFQHDYSFYFSM